MERARLRDAEACLCPLIFFLDGAELDGDGRNSAKVAMMTCGNFVNGVLRRTGARELIALLPELKASKGQGKKAAVKRAKRIITQACIKAIFEPVVVSQIETTDAFRE
jgi:hypothetical protein